MQTQHTVIPPDSSTTDLIAIDAGQLFNWPAIDVQLCRVSRLNYFLFGLWLGGLVGAAAWGLFWLWLFGTFVVGAAVVYVLREGY
jgi:predicted lipid-binding transport protein (Tim44 family)